MSIKIGLYELFAATIPGGFYLLTVIYLLSSFGVINIDVKIINDFSSWLLILVIVAAYSLGLLLDPIAYKICRLLFKKPGKEEIFQRFKSKYPNIKFNFDAEDAPILRAYVKRSNSELGDIIDRSGAARTMFRNFGLNFLFLTIIILMQCIWSPNWAFMIATSLIFLALSLLAFNEYRKWNLWFYQITYESVIAIALENTKLVHIKNAVSTQIKDEDLLKTFLLEKKQSNKNK